MDVQMINHGAEIEDESYSVKNEEIENKPLEVMATIVPKKGSKDETEVEMELMDGHKESPEKKSTSKNSIPDATRRVLRGPLAPVNNCLDGLEQRVKAFYNSNNFVIKCFIYATVIIGYFAYLVVALSMDFERARVLLYLTIITIVCVTYSFIKKYFGEVIWERVLQPVKTNFIDRFWKFIKWILIGLFIVFVIFWIVYDTIDDPNRLISLAGLFIYILIGFLFSTNRSRVKWRPVLWGFALQFVFGLIILRTDFGYQIFKWIGDRITIFLGFSSEGSSFLFRGLLQFAFSVLPIIVYFSAFTYVIWYLGIIQVVIEKIAWVLQVTLGTSPAESFNAAGNIFIGQTEAPLLIRPFLEGMTESELHAVMTGGFATIAGSVLATYIHFGVSAHHLLAASVMSAPAALAMSKLMCPEVEEPAVKRVEDIKVEKTEEKNLFEAIAVGASMSIGLVANIAVMLIAFLSLLKCANAVLGWFGSMVGEPGFSFEFICSYVFMPFAYIMGVSWDDSFKVAELLGVKTFLNEFVAYKRFAALIRDSVDGRTGALSIRSEVITTYALCGFANFGSMGVQLGGIASLAPSKRSVLAKHVLRALIAGTLACFMTACIAGILYEEGKYDTTLPKANTTAATILTTTLMTTLKP